MTNPPVPRVDIGSLNLGGKLGAGGQGSVTAVNHFLISRQWKAVLKTYSADALAMMRPAVLEKIVGYPRQVGSEESRWLYEHTAWPAVIAEDNGRVCGFLMRKSTLRLLLRLPDANPRHSAQAFRSGISAEPR